jgi:hypothetical protein
MRLAVFLFAAFACLPLTSASAQEIPRIKARIVSFNGKILTVTSGTAGQNLTITLLPQTRLMYEDKADALAVKPGDYLGATLVKSAGRWQAQEAHLMPDTLRGAGEGFYPLPSSPDDRIVTGEVTANDPASGLMTVSFRGSAGGDGPTCTGRAPREGGCKGEVIFAVPAKTQVIAIRPGDKSMLVAGKVAAISVVASPDGHLATPGLTIENETGGEVLDVAPKQTKPPAK